MFSSTESSICTTGSQQPNSRRPSPATAVIQTLGENAAFALHPDHTRTHAQSRHPLATWFIVRKARTVALCLGPNLHEDTKQRWKLGRGTGRCGDPHPLWRNARRKQRQQNTYFLCSLAQEGEPGTIVNCQTQHGHFYLSSPQQIKTGNTVLCSPINKAVLAGLHLHRAACCTGVYYFCIILCVCPPVGLLRANTDIVDWGW